MKKLNETVYNKLVLQTEEAQEQKLIKLAEAVSEAISVGPETEIVTYAFTEMNDDVHKELWKAAVNVLKYHDFTSVDVQKVDEVIESFAFKFIDELESSLGVEGTGISSLEPKVLGQIK